MVDRLKVLRRLFRSMKGLRCAALLHGGPGSRLARCFAGCGPPSDTFTGLALLWHASIWGLIARVSLLVCHVINRGSLPHVNVSILPAWSNRALCACVDAAAPLLATPPPGTGGFGAVGQPGSWFEHGGLCPVAGWRGGGVTPGAVLRTRRARTRPTELHLVSATRLFCGIVLLSRPPTA